MNFRLFNLILIYKYESRTGIALSALGAVAINEPQFPIIARKYDEQLRLIKFSRLKTPNDNR